MVKSARTTQYRSEIAAVANEMFPGSKYTVDDVAKILTAWSSMYNEKKNARLKEYKDNEQEFKAFLAARKKS